MWIVALAWIYVVGLMALTEPSVVAGIMTFLAYCLLPLSILFYITGSKRRQARKQRAASSASSASPASDASAGPAESTARRPPEHP